MSATNAEQINQLGFITVLGNIRQGLVGGFLILNLVGRPTEFHCTAPVRPNRAQEILYGNTLEAFLCGDQIARTLISRSKASLLAIVTDIPALLSIQDSIRFPLIYLLKEKKSEPFFNNQQNIGDAENNTEATNSEEKAFSCDSFDATDETKQSFVPGLNVDRWAVITKNKIRLAIPKEENLIDPDQSLLLKQLDPFLKSIDIPEPFERIRLAIEEAQKSV
ncbi:MAG: hypothetical protein Q4C95_10175 [Planctomycetia bacterium]|nr:hypothetical protein [Planctomycetia bacterium]